MRTVWLWLLTIPQRHSSDWLVNPIRTERAEVIRSSAEPTSGLSFKSNRRKDKRKRIKLRIILVFS